MTTSRQFMLQEGCTYGEALKKVADERAANKAKKIALATAVTTSPISVAVAPLKADAIKSANDAAKKKIAYVAAELLKHNMDRELAAPHPHGNMSRADYSKANARYALFHGLTIGTTKGSRHPRQPDPCVMDAERMARFVKACEEAAAAQYEAFVAKLVGKIGATTAATLEGNHVWAYSILTVTKADGSTERWKTQQIANFSKLGKYFPQWPSRRVK